jgi:hypothetical protein
MTNSEWKKQLTKEQLERFERMVALFRGIFVNYPAK